MNFGSGSISAVLATPQKPLAASAYPSHTGPGCRSSADLLLCANGQNRYRDNPLRARHPAQLWPDRAEHCENQGGAAEGIARAKGLTSSDSSMRGGQSFRAARA